MRDTLPTMSILIPDGEGQGLLPLKVLRCLGQVPKTKISILSREKWNPIRLSKHHSGFFDHTIDEFDRERLDAILSLAKQLKVDIILPIDQPTIRLLSAYREEVQFVAALPPLAPPDTLEVASDKWHLAEVLKKESIPFPDTVLVQSKIPDEDTLRLLVFPVLVKPLEGAGGTGIQFFDNSSELTRYLNSEDCPKRLIIQTFIHGYDIDCSVLCQNGEIKAYTIQKGIMAGDKRFAPPSRIEFVRHEQVYSNTERLMRALNFSGVAHIDFRYDEHSKEPKVLEVNPRFWGSVIGSLVAGINFPHLACQLGMKLDFPRPEYQLVHYTKPEVAFKLLIRNYFRGDKTIPKWKETGLPYTFADMGPEFIKYSAPLLGRFSRD